MSNSQRSHEDRSVRARRDIVNNIVVTGNNNIVSPRYERVSLPDPDSVDMRAQLAVIKEAILKLSSPDTPKIENAVRDAEVELGKPQPDKDEVGKALNRALEYAKKADEFASIAEKLKTPIANAAAWLGDNWHKILGVVGLIV